MSKVATCLWFEGNGLEAAEFYVSLIPNSEITMPELRGAQDEPLLVNFTLGGAPYQILNGGPHFKLSEAVSISVITEDQVETDRLWNALTADGGEESMCGWLKDRFGVSWQIVPRPLIDLQMQPDREAAERVRQAMLKMQKIVIADLEAAFKG